MAEPFRVRFVPGVTPGKWLRTWAERMPASPVEASPVDDAEQRSVLVDGAADMCFLRLPVERDGLHVIPLYREVPVVVAAKDHPVAAFEEVDVTDLAAEHLLQDPAEIPEWRAVAEEVHDGTRVEVPPMSVAQAVEVAASGAGVLILPMSVARLHHRKDVVHRPVTGVAESQVGLAWLAENEDPRVETFIGIVRGRTERSTRGGGGAQGAAARAEPHAPTGTGSRGGAARGRGGSGRGEAGRGGAGRDGKRGGSGRGGKSGGSGRGGKGGGSGGGGTGRGGGPAPRGRRPR